MEYQGCKKYVCNVCGKAVKHEYIKLSVSFLENDEVKRTEDICEECADALVKFLSERQTQEAPKYLGKAGGLLIKAMKNDKG